MPSSIVDRPDLLSATVLAAYRTIGFLSRPLIPLSLFYRAARQKESIGRASERFGRPSQPRPSGRVVWIHAASVGETNAVLPLVERLCASGLSVVFTCVTKTAAEIAQKRLPAGAVQQFSPVDVPALITRFLVYWRPEFALFVESELWPATIMKLWELRIPLIVVNARLSPRSFAGWQRFGRLARTLFSRIPLVLARTQSDAQRFAGLGAPDVRVTGNIKFDVPPLAAAPSALSGFAATIGHRPVWVAASTHAGEEEVVAAAHRLLLERHPGLLTILAPRHPERGPDLSLKLTGLGLNVARRSAGEPLRAVTDIYLADTLGELGLFYRVAQIAFLGGSLIPHGGQNPIEPVALDTVVLHGSHVHNWDDVYATLDASGGARQISGAQDLAAAVDAYLNDPLALRRAVAAGSRALRPFAGAIDRTVTALTPYLDPTEELRPSARSAATS